MPHTLTRSSSAKAVFPLVLASFLMASLYPPGANAGQVYKWVDEKGVVTFGDKTQRPASAPAERIEIKADTPARDSSAKDSSEAGATDAGKQPGDKPAPEPKPAVAEKPKMSAAEKRKRCSQARNDLTVFQSHGRMRETDEKGNISYLSDKQKQDRMKALNKNIREFCR